MSGSAEKTQKPQGVQPSSTVKKINSMLNGPKTRVEGLKLLSSYLPYCSDEEFTESCVSWMQNCCKLDGSVKSNHFSLQLLSNLFKMSSKYPELNKGISFFITTRFFDYFFKYCNKNTIGWSCAETCFMFYKGPCGNSQDTIENYLSTQMRKKVKITPVFARCYALLPSLGGGGNEGINYKNNWKVQICRFVKICHSILADLFECVQELQEYESTGETYIDTEDSSFPITNDYLTVQLYNYTRVINYMLMNKYPVSKCIPVDLIFQLICRGLAVSPKNLGKQKTTRLIALEQVLPEVHAILLSTLNALIVTCRNQLLPFSYLICKLIRQTLEWTESDSVSTEEKSYGISRISAYEVLCNWLVASGSGGCVETISKMVLSDIVSDIQPKEKVVQLKDSKRDKTLNLSFEEKISREVISSTKSSLCYAALKTAQFLLKYLGVSLKQEEQKFLQEIVIKLLSNIQNNSPLNVAAFYSAPALRKELYSVLLELTNQPCLNWPPPTHFALRLFAKGRNDTSAEISEFCSSAISILTNIIHPQYGSVQSNKSRSSENEKIVELVEGDDMEMVFDDGNTIDLVEDFETQKNSIIKNKASKPIYVEDKSRSDSEVENISDSEADKISIVECTNSSFEISLEVPKEKHDSNDKMKSDPIIEPADSEDEVLEIGEVIDIDDVVEINEEPVCKKMKSSGGEAMPAKKRGTLTQLNENKVNTPRKVKENKAADAEEANEIEITLSRSPKESSETSSKESKSPVTSPRKSVEKSSESPKKSIESSATPSRKSVESSETSPKKSIENSVTSPRKSVDRQVSSPNKSVESLWRSPRKAKTSEVTTPEKTTESEINTPTKAIESEVTDSKTANENGSTDSKKSKETDVSLVEEGGAATPVKDLNKTPEENKMKKSESDLSSVYSEDNSSKEGGSEERKNSLKNLNKKRKKGSKENDSSSSPEFFFEGIINRDPKKTYFLRSKVSSEKELEEVPKRLSSPDSVKSTPAKVSVKGTPSTQGLRSSQRRTRASSRLEMIESESDSASVKKEDDIMEVFEESLI